MKGVIWRKADFLCDILSLRRDLAGALLNEKVKTPQNINFRVRVRSFWIEM